MYWRYVKAFLVVVGCQVALAVSVAAIGVAWLAVAIVAFWASTAINVILAIMIGFLYYKAVGGDWDNLLDVSVVDVEHVDITAKDGLLIHAVVLRPKGDPGSTAERSKTRVEQRPAILCHHGLAGTWKRELNLAVPLVMAGMVALLPDARAHGETRKRGKFRKDDWYIDQESGILPDVHSMIDYLASLPGVDPERISMLGTSLGGAACLTSGVSDERVRLAIAINPPHSFSGLVRAKRARVPFTEPWFMVNGLRGIISFSKVMRADEMVSPMTCLDKMERDAARAKVRLVRCEDDKLVLPEASSDKIIEQLDLPGESVLSLKKGDHGFRGQETIVMARIQHWLREAGLGP